MNYDTLFLVCNYSTVPAWTLLVFAPKWKFTWLFVHSIFMPCLLAIAYCLLLFTDTSKSNGASMFTLDGVMAIFDKQQTVIACWIHYLVFDLFVGAWCSRDALRNRIHHAYVAPCLIATLFFGPLGLMCYLIVRSALGKGQLLAESPSDIVGTGAKSEDGRAVESEAGYENTFWE